MTRECDTLDRQIVDALQHDGRASALDIASAIDAPVTTVQKRLKRLREDDVITGTEPRIDYAQFGYDLTAIFKLDLSGEAVETLMARLQDTRHIVSVYEVTGTFDVLAIGKYTDTQSMDEQIKTLVTDPTVTAANTSIVLDTVCEGASIELSDIELSDGDRTS